MANRVLLAVAGLVASVLALAAGPASAESPAAPSCIQVSTEVRYRGVGYDHVVHVASSCSTSATCNVSSDVATDPVTVTVPAGAQVEVVTLRGSPARVFKPRVSCALVL